MYILLAKGQVPRTLREPRGKLAFGREFTKGGSVKGGVVLCLFIDLFICLSIDLCIYIYIYIVYI